MAEIQLKHVYKKYDDSVTAVSDFNLQIEDKEFVIFVGPSGCGKSTTLRMIAGLEEISQGELFIDGKEMNHVPSCDRDIAMVFQNYALYPHMTVAENMAYSMRLKGVSKKDRRKKVEEVAKILGLSQVLDRKPAELSGGQKQRVAMGRAIVRHPKAFLMDEPLSNLDAKLRNQMRAEIMKLYTQLDTTFIYVTHDQTEAMTLGTKIVVMKEGEIQQIATPEELYNEPANLFVASFIGVPQMNFFQGKCGIDENKHAVVRIEDRIFHVSEELEKRIYEKGYMGEKVIVGIRPEDMIILPDESEDGLEAKVNVYEMLGPEAYLYFDYNKESRAIRTDADTKIRKGDRIKYTFREDRIHLFDPQRENRI
ncbi:MAG: sn-glycerol-3-phosphate ABC transporter ATP-binding protein UgpC [Ruminococcus sp.]|nr:sn-glycerol-3-phosphate ABC transporter ATP-binding protein UgpC [Ruminococcus sp.]